MRIFFALFCCIGSLHLAHAEVNLTPLPNYQERLVQLEARIHKDLALLDYPQRPWLPVKKRSDGAHIYDVVIVGGGQTGMTIAFALRKEKVTNVAIFDENPEGREGPWLTYAHMPCLRTPKCATGPDCNIPSLTCEEWFEAKYGLDTWCQCQHVPRTIWAEYLKWFRKTLNLSVINGTRVGALEWDAQENCFIVPIQSRGNQDRVYARKVVLATGLQGSGGWAVPSFISNTLPKTFYSSAYEDVNFAHLRGKRIAILGAGATAFDNALICHEHGAEEIHIFSKRSELANVDSSGWAEYVGFLKHFSDLPDEDKLKFMSKLSEFGGNPTAEAVHKARMCKNIFLHFESPWTAVENQGDEAIVYTPKGIYAFDYLLISIGGEVDLSRREELKKIYPEIALWADRVPSQTGQPCSGMFCMPYLGRNYEFTEKHFGQAPYLRSIFNCTAGASASGGFSIGLMGMKYSIPKLVYGIVSQLFVDDRDYFYNTLENFNELLFNN